MTKQTAPHAQSVTVSPAYAAAQLARAMRTSASHADAGTRERAGSRIRQWQAVLSGIATGHLTVGSRTPVAGLPSWVTPEVVRGGFATGAPAAGGPLAGYEEEAARRAGVPADRVALFSHALTEEGLARLWELLDSGRYEVALPEEAALLTVAWLVRAGDLESAAALVTEIQPFADRLRFLPRPTDRPAADAGAVHRRSVGEVAAELAGRQPKAAIEAQREALTVWRPFEDELLAYWLRHGTERADGTGRTDDTGRAAGMHQPDDATRAEPGAAPGAAPVASPRRADRALSLIHHSVPT
ncbi:hypothetical protein GPJ59_35020, partial [Streptomyces bambusae]|nr:hypothetical protein [Streptomyces bambusae]